MKIPKFKFNGGRKQATMEFPFSFWTWVLFLGIQLQDSSPYLPGHPCTHVFSLSHAPSLLVLEVVICGFYHKKQKENK